MTKSKKRRLPESSAGGTGSSSDGVEDDAPPAAGDDDDRRDDDRVAWSKSKKKRMRKKREAARRQSTAVAEEDDGGRGGGGDGGGGRTNGHSIERDDGPPDEKDDDGVIRDGGAVATVGIGGEPSEYRGEAVDDDDDGRNGKKKRQRKEKGPSSSSNDDDPKSQSSVVASKSGGRSASPDDGGGGPKKEGKAMRSARDDDDDVTRRSTTSSSGPNGAAEYDDAVPKPASKSGDVESPEGRSIDVDRASARTDVVGGDTKTKKKKKKKKKKKNIADDDGEPKRDGQDQSAPSSTRRDYDDASQESASKSGKEDVLESPKKRSSDVDGAAAKTDEVCGSASKKKKKKKKTKKNKEGNGSSSPPKTSGPRDPTSVEGRCDEKARDEAHDDSNLGRGESPISQKVKISLPKPSQMSTLQRDFLEQLTSSRFRELNEDLYTHPSDQSFERFTQQPELFDQYHVGFRKQAKSWPVNPVDVIYKKIVGGWTRDRQEEAAVGEGRRSSDEGGGKRGGKKTVIADFGCGDAKLAKKLLALRVGKDGKSLAQASAKDKERQYAPCPFEVFSFDLVSGGNPLVTPADMSDVPLPDEAVDVAVYSLALMGTNVADFVREAWRVLRFNGVLRVAEVRSRFETAAGGPDEEDETATNKRGKSNNGKWHQPSKSVGHRARRNAPDDSGDGAPPRHLMLLDEFLSLMERCGFQCTYMDRSNKMFLFMDFVKLEGSTGLSDKERFTAKACIYKKR
ncbi:hypothetical protein ACHAW5_011150 [Stephanodiscus triporus]|uniref:Ribosomal RNA-processing protein 8 n=1 Tax=Stephanodiscus triporus TaxID=2934178 RepID=A0ABD3QVF0_9STRA